MKLPNIFAKNAVAVRYATGAIIFEIGQPRDLMFIVQEGEVDIKIGDKIVETVSADGFFGEMALIDGGVRVQPLLPKQIARSSQSAKSSFFLSEFEDR